jgi:phosphoribosyl-ATP pyrophosphohydrolase
MERWKIYRCECGHSKYCHSDEHDEVPTGTGRCDDCDCQCYKNRPLTLDELVKFVKELHYRNAIHKKRGFRLQDSTKLMASSHMLEEAVELQAEACIENHHDGIVEESADVLATWLHLLLHCEVEMQEVIDKCVEKLLDIFTYDEAEILTGTPGYSRRHRDSGHHARTSAVGESSQEVSIQDETC